MTVAALNPSIQFIEDGVTVGFPVPFRFKSPQHLAATRIFADGTSVALAYGPDYSATGGQTDSGGTLTVVAAALAGTRLAVTRATPRQQAMNYTTADTFPAESHEAALDNSMLVDQEQDVAIADVNARALLVPIGEQSADLPLIADRANMFLGFDAIGRPIALTGGGADGALRGDLALNGGVMVATDDNSTAQDDINAIRGPYPKAAAGDGVTNDKAAIDLVNNVGRVIDLQGKDYAYTGDVDLTKAMFVNGRVISSTMGTLDFRSAVIFDERVITVGAAGTIKKLRYLMAYLRQLRIQGKVTVSLLERNTPNDATGSMALDIANFYHPDMARIAFVGPAFGGGQGVPADVDMPGRAMANYADARAADRAFLYTKFGASIYFTGTDDLNGVDGLSAIGGFSATRIYFDNRTRYNLAVNWLSSHSNKLQGGGAVYLENCALDGGVWGMTIFSCHIVLAGRNLFSTQKSGGGIFADNCTFYKAPSDEIYFYHPKSTPAATFQKYMIHARRCDFLWEPDGANLNRIFGYGPSLHGLYLLFCIGSIPDVSYDGVTQPRTQVGGSMEYGRPKVRNADPANTALTTGAVQPGMIGNAVAGTLFFVSSGGVARYRGVDVAACICESYFVGETGGVNECGFNAKEDITTSKATAKAFRAFCSAGSVHRPNVSAALVGSVDGFAVVFGARVFLYDSAGISPDIALNTESNGNYIATP